MNWLVVIPMIIFLVAIFFFTVYLDVMYGMHCKMCNARYHDACPNCGNRAREVDEE